MSISVCIIAKDEEANIRNCIESVNDVADEIIVLDTGSSDKTIEISSKFDKVKIYTTTWKDDFSKARNECISYAKSDWVLSIDADETLICNDNLNEYIKTLNDFDVINFQVTNYSKTFSKNFFTRALFKNNIGIKFTGLVHEYLICKNNKLNEINTNRFILKHKNDDFNINKSKYYINLLNKAISQDKNNIFHYYKHLANEYQNIGNYDLSISYYQNYLDKVKDEYVYISLIKLLIDKKGNYKKAFKYSSELLKLSNDNVEAIFYQGYCLLNLNEYKKSINIFQKLLSIIKLNSELKTEIIYKSYFGIGLSYYKIKDGLSALKYFNQAKELINTKEVNSYISRIGVRS